MLKAKAKDVWQNYLSLWNGLSGWKWFLFYTLHYTALFTLLSTAVFSDFREAGKTFMWTTDAMPQHFPRLLYLSQTIREGIESLLAGDGWTFPLYDFRLGPVKMDLQFEPIQWLAVLCPWDTIDIFYDFLVVLRYYFVGLSFSLFGFYFKQKPLPVLIGTVSYVFCGFALYAGVRHPFFLSPMIFLPLLIIGAEQVLRGKKSLLFLLTVTLALLSNLYFACMLAILVVLYILVRFFCLYKEDRPREFLHMTGRLAIWGGTGIMLSGCVMIPTLLQMTGTGRVGRNVTEFTNLWHYNAGFYEELFSNFLLTPSDLGNWTCLGFSVLSIPAVILLFIRRKKEERTLRAMFLLLTAMIASPCVAYIMSGFNAISARWCFGYAFCVAAITMFMIPDLATVNRQTLTVIGAGSVAYFSICYFVLDRSYFTNEPFLMLLVAVLLIVLCHVYGDRGKRFAPFVCLIVTCLSVYYSSYLMYDPEQRNYVSEFTAKETPYEVLNSRQYSSLVQSKPVKEDDTFYRVAGSNITRAELNSSWYYGLNGLTFYTSVNYSNYMQWLSEMESARYLSMHQSYGLTSRAPMLTLANVKYYALRESSKFALPYGFSEIDRIENGNKTDVILENQFALPIGYTYDSYLMLEGYETLSALGKQEAQLQAVVLEEKPKIDVGDADNLEITANKVPVTVFEANNLTWKDGKLKVNEENATLTLEFEGIPNTETYLRIVNLDLTSGSSTRRWTLTAATGETSAKAQFIADAYLYAHGQKTQLLDLGYTEEGYTTCTITFPSKGTFMLEDIEIWCQPMDNYGDQVNALREEALENVETNWRGLTGTISVSKDKMLCIAIPYDTGWSAYVDGEKVDIYKANTAFMGIELEAGDHEIELRYWVPGLTIGIVISCVGVACLVALIVDEGKKRQSR